MEQVAEAREFIQEAKREFEAVSPKVKEKGFFDRFMARDHILHERAFYDGDVIEEEIEGELSRVEFFIKDIEEL